MLFPLVYSLFILFFLKSQVSLSIHHFCIPERMLLFVPLLLSLLLHWPPSSTNAQLLAQRASSIFGQVKEPTCRPVDIALCRDIPYNRTIFPNPLMELDLASLQAQTEHFKPLIRTRCSPHILFFICSAFAPMCPEQMPQAVTSCRSVCEEVQRDCIKIFHDFDFPWPPMLNCSRFPSPPALCMRPEPMQPIPPIGPNHHQHSSASSVGQMPPTKTSAQQPECPQDLVDMDAMDPMGKCAFRCEKTTMFKKDRKEQARLWLLCWALLNSIVALFTVCSFWIDRRRFRFPERSVCFLALCSLASSVPHILRPFVGFDTMACAQLSASSSASGGGGPKFLILDGPQENSACLLSFLLAYYFPMAGAFWWLLLGFTWYLSAARKWVEEEIGKRSLFLHVLAWGMPALMSAGAISARLVDASELTGICSIGNADPMAMLGLWLLPQLFLTLLGLTLWLSGFSAMCKERNLFRRRGTDTSRLEKFLFKMSSFVVLYVISALIGSFCDFHQLSVLTRWHPNTIGCKQRGGTFSGQCIRPEQPELELFVLGQTMRLTTALITGLWIFSPKTLISWRRALLCCWPAPSKQTTAQMATTGFALINGSPPPLSTAYCPSSLPPSHRPLLPSAAAVAEPPHLPPPPPTTTGVPSSSVTNSHHQHFFLPHQHHRHHQQHHYIPLSVLTSHKQSLPGDHQQSDGF